MAGYMNEDTYDQSGTNDMSGQGQEQFNQPMDSGDGGSAMFPENGRMTGMAPMPKDAPLVIHDRPMPQQQSSSSSSGGGIGDVIGGIAKVLPFFFAEGGPVGFAHGGSVASPHAKALVEGYTTGALHEKKYGGKPQALAAAAQEAKSLLSGGSEPAQGFAAGGQAMRGATGNADQVQMAIMKSLGLAPDGSVMPPQATPSKDNSMQYIEPPPKMPAPQPNQMQQNPMPSPSLNNESGSMGPAPATVSPNQGQQGDDPNRPPSVGGYMAGGAIRRGFAAGGPGEAPGGPQRAMPQPLKPGQVFQGDGKVSGPGGPGSDSIPAKLSDGEFVISAPAVKFFGVDKFQQMNEKGKQGFMQAMGQVDANQQAPGGPPQEGAPSPTPGAPTAPPPMTPPGPSGQPPMQQKHGGLATSNTKSGYMGM